jgi:hypothetical protein
MPTGEETKARPFFIQNLAEKNCCKRKGGNYNKMVQGRIMVSD